MGCSGRLHATFYTASVAGRQHRSILAIDEQRAGSRIFLGDGNLRPSAAARSPAANRPILIIPRRRRNVPHRSRLHTATVACPGVSGGALPREFIFLSKTCLCVGLAVLVISHLHGEACRCTHAQQSRRRKFSPAAGCRVWNAVPSYRRQDISSNH